MRRSLPTWILLLAMTVLCCAPAQGADSADKYALRGAGLTTCKAFVKAYAEKGALAHVYFGWIDGYISGLNELSPTTFDRAPWQSTELLAEVVRRACTKAPDSYFFAELRAVVAAMADQSLARAQEKKILEMGDDRALVYPDTIRRAQTKLKTLGHYDGAVHGKFDPLTQAAIIKFQKAKGIPINGLPGPITLWALLIEQ